MIYIFDLDYTLFNTNIFTKNIAQTLDINLKDFNISYWQYFGRRKINYNIYKHINFLIKEGKINSSDNQKIRNKIIKLFNEADKYIFSGAREVLCRLKSQGHSLYLLSFGDPIWQKLKISDLAIKKYFTKIIITNKKKSTALDFLKKTKEKKIIVNDNARESFLIKKALGQAEIILIKGPYSHNMEHKLKTHILLELSNILRD